MNDIVRKVFNMLGVEPYEKFKIEGNGDIIYYFDEELYIYRDGEFSCSDKGLHNLINGYFKIIKLPKEPKKKKLKDLAPEEWDKWKDKNCPYNSCGKCIFKYTSCIRSRNKDSWINNKELYDDEFLDKEIEVKE